MNAYKHLEAEIAALNKKASAYESLHDGLSDMIESGRLTEVDIPDDYQWLVEKLAALANYGPQNDRDITHASLIAAAPDMFAALKRFTRAMEQHSYPELQHVTSYAFAAIAKVQS